MRRIVISIDKTGTLTSFGSIQIHFFCLRVIFKAILPRCIYNSSVLAVEIIISKDKAYGFLTT